MLRTITTAILSLVVIGAASQESSDTLQSVGLVLSGGGAKGIAHIGVIRALEDNNIPIDYIAGTSMGAIVGGLYAAGYTTDEMMDMIRSRSFSYWSTGKIDRSLTYYFSESEPTPALVNITLGARDSSEVKSILPGSLINPLPMNFAFMDLFSAYTAQCGGDFDRLFVPFRCVTSDVYRKHKIVLRSGSLGDAIRASMSFPMVFHPIEMDSVLVYDGGIYDNFPVDVMREDFAPSIMIGVNVSGPDKKPNPNDLFQQLEDMIIQNNDYSLPAEEGIKIKVHVSQYGLLDFGKAREIYKAGYDRAMEMIDSIKKRVTTRIAPETRRLRRSVFKSQTPYVRFDSVSVTGGTPSQNEFISYLFDHKYRHHTGNHNHTDTFGIAKAREAYYRAITGGRLKNLLPQAVYDSSDGLFNLNLKATVKDNFTIGFGGYISSSSSSMLFMSAGYNTLSFHALETNVNAWIGQSYMAASANAKINLRTSVPSRLHLQLVGSRQKFYENDKLFFEDNEPVFITNSELFSRLNFEWGAGRRGKALIGVGYGHLTDKFYSNNRAVFAVQSRDQAVQNLAQAIARFEYNTLDNVTYPTTGSYCRVTAIGLTGNYEYRPSDKPEQVPYDHPFSLNRTWVQGEAAGKHYFRLGNHFSLGLEGDAFYSTRSLLDNYNAAIVDAPEYNPTPSSYNSFNSAFRSTRFVAAGIVPVWRMSGMVQMRGSFHGFLPMREIKENIKDGSAYYGGWFRNPEFYGELAAVVTLPFANVTAYGSYASSPARNWTFGLSFGLFILAPDFLR